MAEKILTAACHLASIIQHVKGGILTHVALVAAVHFSSEYFALGECSALLKNVMKLSGKRNRKRERLHLLRTTAPANFLLQRAFLARVASLLHVTPFFF